MKKDIHPEYRYVVFQDTGAGLLVPDPLDDLHERHRRVGGRQHLPVAKVDISHRSHPFFTGTMTIVDTAGRVERFERRYGKRRKG